MRVITIADIHKACGDNPGWPDVVEYMMDCLQEDDYLVLHIPEEYQSKGGTKAVAMLYVHEAWVIRQVGPATCIKHRAKETPFDCWF